MTPSPAAGRTNVDLEIDGMTCASCATRIERKLGKLPGVVASVNYATHKAHILTPDGIGLPDLVATVEAAGYGARIPDPAVPPPAETDRLRWRLILAVAAGLPVMVVSMVPPFQFTGWQWVALAATLAVYAVAGWRFHRATLLNLRHGTVTMDTLVSLGTTAALAMSLVALAGPAGHAGYHHTFAWMAMDGRGLYFEAVAGIITFLLVGRYLEARATAQAGEATSVLLSLTPATTTLLLDDGTSAAVPVDALRVGDRFLVSPGETVPADGIVVEGRSAVDNSLMTGESVPLDAGPGASVVGGALNTDGTLVVRAERVGADTRLAHITRLVEEAQSSKSQIQRLADRISGIFVPIVIGLSLVTLAAWLLTGHGLAPSVASAVAVVIVACPCAMGLATPVALLAGVGRGAQLGIVVRGAQALEAARRLDCVALDKTGTLTTGRMSVTGIHASPGTGRDELVTVAAAAGAGSSHPLSRAIAALAPTVPAAAQATAVPGRGIRAAVAGHAVVLGRPDWVGAEVASHETASAPPAEGAGTAVAVGWDGAVRGTFEVHDAVRPDAAAAVAAFRHLGLAPVLLTGDAPGPARTVAAQTGIEDVRAALAPADKVAAIAALQAAGRRVAMVGDGINDAAALAQADLGIAMGGGTDAAIAAADLTLMRADLTLAVDAVRLARVCFRTIRTNFFWALAYNVVAIPVAAAGWLNPMIAGAAMACSSLFVVGNSLRLRWFRPAQA